MIAFVGIQKEKYLYYKNADISRRTGFKNND